MIQLPQADQAAIELDRELVRRGGLREFVRMAWGLVEPGLIQWNWHLDVKAEYLEAASRGEIRNVLFCEPPGCMKSLLVSSFWPAWDWIDHPERKYLAATYAQTLSNKNAKHHRNIVLSRWYQERWGDRCSITRESTKQVQMFENNAHGFRFSSSTGAGVLGRHADVLLFDDLSKTQDAQGRAAVDGAGLAKANAFWFESMATRQANPETTIKIGIQQRLHEDDTAGRCIDSGEYECVILPMEFDPSRRCLFSIPVTLHTGEVVEEDPREAPGELLWPARYPQHEVDSLRDTLGPVGASAQLDQQPRPPGGAIFKAEDFERVYDVLPKRARKIVVVDCSFEDEQTAINPDYAVMQCWAEHEGKIYMVDQVRAKLDFVATVEALRAFVDLHDVTTVWVEKKANGAAVIRTLRDEVPGIRAWPPKGEAQASKVERANAAQPSMRDVYYPRGWAQMDVYRKEHLGFPLAKNDDQVDGTTMAVSLLARRTRKRYKKALEKLSKGRT